RLPPVLSFPTRRSSDLPGLVAPGRNKTCRTVKGATELAVRQRRLALDTQHFLARQPGDQRHPADRLLAALQGEILVSDFHKHLRSEEHTSELQSRENLV